MSVSALTSIVTAGQVLVGGDGERCWAGVRVPRSAGGRWWLAGHWCQFTRAQVCRWARRPWCPPQLATRHGLMLLPTGPLPDKSVRDAADGQLHLAHSLLLDGSSFGPSSMHVLGGDRVGSLLSRLLTGTPILVGWGPTSMTSVYLISSAKALPLNAAHKSGGHRPVCKCGSAGTCSFHPACQLLLHGHPCM